MKILRDIFHILLMAIAAAAFVALFLGLKRLIGGPFQPTEATVLWCWDNIFIYAGSNRWWDPLTAAAWVVVPAMMILDRARYCSMHWTPIFGLVASGGLHLMFWGEPGVLFWLLMPMPALLIARIVYMIDERQATLDGEKMSLRFGFIHATSFMYTFGLGMMLPMALMHGFWLATIVWWMYALCLLAQCAVVFGILNVHRPFVWTYRKIRDRHRNRATDGASQ